MKLVHVALILCLALLVGCTNTPEPSPTPPPTQTQTPSSPSPSPTSSPDAASATQIVYTLEGRNTTDRSRLDDVYLYDVATDRVRRLTFDGETVRQTMPRFRGTKVTFVVDRDLIELDQAGGTPRRLLRVSGQNLIAYAWSPDRKEVAYIESLSSGERRLRVHSFASGTVVTLKRFGITDGRGTTDLDTVTIDWSRSGDRLLVNFTYPDDSPTLRLIRRRDGADVIKPVRNATSAVWSSDEKSIYLLATSATGSDQATWQTLDIASERRRALALQRGAFHASLSPDGTRLAGTTYDRERKDHAVWVLDLRSGTQIRVAKGYRDALWLDGQTLALTRVVACSTADGICDYYGYRATGTREVTLSRQVSALTLGSTLWDGLGKPSADVRYS